MTERIPAPADIDDTNWNNDGVTYPPTPPNAAKRLTGYKPKDVPTPGPGEIITADEQNWLHGLEMQLWTWAKQFIAREWSELSEGIASITTARFGLFRVCPADIAIAPYLTSLRQSGKINVADPSTGAGNPVKVRTDGEYLYYHINALADYIVAVSPVDGALVWERAITTGHTATALATDGAAVYWISSNVGSPGLRLLDRTDGTNQANGGTEYNCDKLVVNGEYAVGANGTVNGAGTITFWGTLTGTPVQTGFVGVGGTKLGLAIDETQVYTCGTRSTNDVWAYNLNSRALAWQVTLDANDPSPCNACVADGDYVYVGTDRFATAAGPTRNLFCLSRFDGSLVWSMEVDPASAIDIDRLTVDDRYLWAEDSSGTLYQIRLRGGAPSVVASLQTTNGIVSDGIAIYGPNAGTPGNFQGIWIGGPTKTYMRADGNDPARRPFYMRAVPTGEI
ncbi:MAG: outer membrane protein assembly factor BamB family protein [Planctomycetota bacterium]|jgi:hypothetical protein